MLWPKRGDGVIPVSCACASSHVYEKIESVFFVSFCAFPCAHARTLESALCADIC